MECRLCIRVVLEVNLRFLLGKMDCYSCHRVWYGHYAELMRQHTAWSAQLPHQSSSGTDTL